MKSGNVPVRVLALVFGAATCAACGEEDATIGPNGGPGGPGANGAGGPGSLPAAIDGFSWDDPPPAGVVRSNPQPLEIAAKDTRENENVFDCTTYDHEHRGSYDKIVWLSEQSGPVKPGLVLQGKPFKAGNLQPLPIKRTPIRISVNLAIPNPTRTIDSPDTASIQEAISKFQTEADALADVPGNIEHTLEEVTRSEQIALSLGLHASYSGILASASLDTNLTHEMGLTQHTVVARLVQPMYTVSFADEAIPTAREFFDPNMTDGDWKAQETSGTISSDNPPVFISSVTYGRMILVSLTSTKGETRDTMKTLIEGSTAAYSASASIEAQRAEQWASLKHQEYQRGGSANLAADAITSGDFRKFFGKAAPSTMVPIAFTVKTLNGTRKVARIGDLTKYNAPDCVTTGSWKPVTTLADGAFKSIGVGLADDAWAVNATQPTKLFKYDRTAKPAKFVPVDVTFAPNHASTIQQVSVGRDGTVGARLADESGLLYRASTKQWSFLDECRIHYDCGHGGRPFYGFDVFDENLMAVTNREDVTWTSNGYATGARFIDWSDTGLVGIDQFHKIWHAPNGGGMQLIDGDTGGGIGVGSIGKVDSLAVGAPNDVWITSNGANFQFDARWLSDRNVNPWIPRNMGTQMPIIDVGVDGHLWGIGADGRIYHWLGLRP